MSYPATPFEIVIKELDGKTAKMYRGGKICLSAHFKPLWGKNVPHFGIAHALALGVSSIILLSCSLALFVSSFTVLSLPLRMCGAQLAPWLAAEVPHLVDSGIIKEDKSKKEKKGD